jgi:hypothetical protein
MLRNSSLTEQLLPSQLGLSSTGLVFSVGVESIITETTTGSLYQLRMLDVHEYRVVSGMIGRGNRSTRRKPPQCVFIHHKSYVT